MKGRGDSGNYEVPGRADWKVSVKAQPGGRMNTSGTNEGMYQQNALTPREAAKYLRVSEAALRLWRSRGEGPLYFRAGPKLVRYRRIDLDLWIEERLSGETQGTAGGAVSTTATRARFLSNQASLDPQTIGRNH